MTAAAEEESREKEIVKRGERRKGERKERKRRAESVPEWSEELVQGIQICLYSSPSRRRCFVMLVFAGA